ncbi:proton-conducting transporter membrane subunit [Bdellovibrio sp.]|uniref:complex I subunit 5 family protein n=1 Tax=Bdellovibrio sp. TaxID=28201 RepID=UPI0032221288
MIAAPVLISFVFALITLLLRRHSVGLRAVSLLGTALSLMIAVWILITVWEQGPQRMQIGNWPAPFGISFDVGMLGALMIAGSALVAFCGQWAMQSLLGRRWEILGIYSLYHFLMMGVYGSFATGDLFNLYVWFEVLLAASFFLVALSRHRSSATGSFKYAVISILSSVAFLFGISFVYASVGSLDLSDIIQQQQLHGQSLSMIMGLSFLVLAFLVKAAVFPFFFWLPASYPVTLTPVAAVFSGFLTKVGLYSLLRILSPVVAFGDSTKLLPVMYGLALASMVLGVLGALSRDNMKGILAFHGTSQMGYILLGLSLGGQAGIVACVFYLLHHMMVKTNLFLSVAYMEKVGGTSMVSESGGLWAARPWLAGLFAMSALSLIGVPPFSGFWAKVLTLQAALGEQRWAGVLLCLGVSLFTLMSMLKIWNGVFWKRAPRDLPEKDSARVRWLVVPLVILNISILAIGLGYPQVRLAAEKVAQELLPGKGAP